MTLVVCAQAAQGHMSRLRQRKYPDGKHLRWCLQATRLTCSFRFPTRELRLLPQFHPFRTSEDHGFHLFGVRMRGGFVRLVTCGSRSLSRRADVDVHCRSRRGFSTGCVPGLPGRCKESKLGIGASAPSHSGLNAALTASNAGCDVCAAR